MSELVCLEDVNNCVEGLEEVHNGEVSLLTSTYIEGDIIYTRDKLVLALSHFAEIVLKWMEYIVFVSMVHDVTGHYICSISLQHMQVI